MLSAQRAKNGEPQPASTAAHAENVSSKRDLASWWRQFKRGNAKREEEAKVAEPHGIFGVPLQDSIKYANVAISLFDEEGNSYIYGYVPIVVAKCGVFLKEKATDVEGIFRLAGSEKRIKELREAFNSPDRYGKGLDWTGYTVHDAANILRRYFNQLPEPIIPLQYYERFRDPLRPLLSQAGGADSSSHLVGDFDIDAIIRVYQRLITEIPPLNRQLLLYILDLLAVFAAKSDQNKMTTQNLAAIFQPGILNHPQHDMAPNEYRLSQAVLVFLIENQDHFLVGMRGTAADAQTIQEVQSGVNSQRGSTTPTRSKTTNLGRSSSNASAGAESVRRYGGVRRNVSVSSRNSKASVAGQSPVTPSFNGGGVHRSNTMPSKKSPALPANRFNKERPSDPPTPATPSIPTAMHSPQSHLAPPEVISPPSEDSTPLASEVNPIAEATNTPEKPAPQPVDQLSPPRAGSVAASTGDGEGSSARSFSSIFVRSSSQEPKEGRRPNKLQKRRMPGSSNPSAHSSTQSLTAGIHDAPPSPLPAGMQPVSSAVQTGIAKEPLVPPIAEAAHSRGGDTLKPSMSPSASFRSHSTVTDLSELEQGEETPVVSDAADKEKKRRWRFSNHQRKDSEKTVAQGDSALGLNSGAQQSMSSVSSAGERGRKSVTLNRGPASPEQVTSVPVPMSPEYHGNGTPSKDGEKKGPIDWFRGKLAERKAEKERAKSPPDQFGGAGSRSSLHLGRPKEEQAERSGRSMDIPRPKESDQDATPTPTRAPSDD